jgi:hypothetical protein
MNDCGREKLRQVRKLIQKKYAISCEQEKENRIQMTPRTRMKKRIQEASTLSIENIFAQEFQLADQIQKEEFFHTNMIMIEKDHHDLFLHQQQQLQRKTTTSILPLQEKKPNECSFIPSVPAPSLSLKPSQLVRPTRIKTPKKVLKRIRSSTNESSAEKHLPIRKIKQSSNMAFSRSSSLHIVSATPVLDETIQFKQPLSMVPPRLGNSHYSSLSFSSSSSSSSNLHRFPR